MRETERAKRAITITVRLTREQHEILQRLCRLKNMSQTAYLATLATEQARQELLEYAVRAYSEGKASLSELATRTGLDVPTIMEAVTAVAAPDARARDAFLAAARSLAKAHQDPEFYALAVQACASEQ